ncbi:hypothetical protein [Limnohabitans sp. T6-5]|uniref:hypothetical protein n=1 Tax=Limnohabitans sp. T6-5 TaxID=1100724 RepID=UPI000D34773C|nr:hypothetical protein [Limnohabitans sp. T6-5]
MYKDRSPLEYLTAFAIAYVAGFLSASLLRAYTDHVQQKARQANNCGSGNDLQSTQIVNE